MPTEPINGASRGTPPDFLPKNPLKRAFFSTYLKLTHSRMVSRLWDLSAYPSPNGRLDWMEITELALELPGLPEAFDGYRIAHISDLHVGTWLKSHGLVQAVEQVNAQSPDLVAITGDFVTSHPEDHAPSIIEALKALTPRDGILAVLGNHDHWTDACMIREILTSIGAQDMSNRVVSLERKAQHLYIAGVDCSYLGFDQLDLVLNQLPAGEAAILLAHEPDYAVLSSATGRFGLQLSGHSHGGQVCFPRIGPLFLPRHGKLYPSGLYNINGMQLYSNRGLGTAELQVRINCPPEIAVINLISSPG